eukprot:Gb_41120 [translate_table: standard]
MIYGKAMEQVCTLLQSKEVQKQEEVKYVQLMNLMRSAQVTGEELEIEKPELQLEALTHSGVNNLNGVVSQIVNLKLDQYKMKVKDLKENLALYHKQIVLISGITKIEDEEKMEQMTKVDMPRLEHIGVDKVYYATKQVEVKENEIVRCLLQMDMIQESISILEQRFDQMVDDNVIFVNDIEAKQKIEEVKKKAMEQEEQSPSQAHLCPTEAKFDARSGQAKLITWMNSELNSVNCIYVVDSLDRERIGKARAEFQAIINDPFMKNSAILVFANKQDMKGAMSPMEVCEGLGLFNLHNRRWHIQGSCATKGEGLYEGLDWLSVTLKEMQATGVSTSVGSSTI